MNMILYLLFVLGAVFPVIWKTAFKWLVGGAVRGSVAPKKYPTKIVQNQRKEL